eukprot:1719870-Amphidinium_carterae.1
MCPQQAFRHMNSIAAMGSSRLSPTGTYSRELSSDPDSGRAAMQLSQDEREERRASDRHALSIASKHHSTKLSVTQYQCKRSR